MNHSINGGSIFITKLIHNLGQMRSEEANRGEIDNNDPSGIQHLRLVVLTEYQAKVRSCYCAVDDQHSMLYSSKAKQEIRI